MARTTLSVGVPTYNQASFLAETLDCLLRQTRMPDEIVLSDHFSTDETAGLIERYRSRFPELIRAVTPPAGSNLTGQYNFTLGSQTSDWITLLSSDDLVAPTYCETMVRVAEKYPEAALIRTGWQNIDEAGTVLSDNLLLSVPREEKFPANLLSQRHGPKVSFAAFALRREAYLSSGPISGSLESLADWALFVQLTPFGSYIRESAMVSSYRVGHDGNKFRRRLGAWLRDEERMFREVFPLAAARGHLEDCGWIERASRSNYYRYLEAASKEFAGEERAEVAPLFASWAASLGEEAVLRKFSEGQPIVKPRSLRQKVEEAVKPLARKVLSRVRGG